MRPTVAVVIPVRDDAVELATCLRLLAAQTRVPDEIIVVDNGSRDDSAAVARAAGARVVTEERIGIPWAAAAGYDAVTADVIARLDADSRPGAEWVSLLAEVMGDPGVDAATGIGHFHDLPRPLRRPAAVAYLGAYYALTWLAVGNTPLWGSSMAVRRTSWKGVSGHVHRSLDVHDDMDLTFALGPDAVIRLDRRLAVGVSGRSLRGLAQLRRRLDRAVVTLRVNWDVEPPWQRWRRRLTRTAR